MLVRGVREEDIKRIPAIANTVAQGTLDGFDTGGGVAIGRVSPSSSSPSPSATPSR